MQIRHILVAGDEVGGNIGGVFRTDGNGPMAVARGGVIILPGLPGWAGGGAGAGDVLGAVAAPLVLGRVGGLDFRIGTGRGSGVSIPIGFVAFSVKEDVVDNAAETPGVVVGGGPPPDQVVAVAGDAKDVIQQGFEVMAGGVVAVIVDAAGGLEQAAHFGQAFRHIGEIGEHTGGAEHQVEAGDGAVGGMADGALEAFQAAGGGLVPAPGVGESADLGGGAVAASVEDVVVGVAVEGGIQVNQVGAFVRPFLHPVQAVAEVEGLVFHNAAAFAFAFADLCGDGTG